MSLEYLTLVRNDYKGLQDIFTNTIKVDIKQKGGLIAIDINDGVARLIIKASNILKGGKSRYKRKKSKRKKSKRKKSKRKKTRKRRGRKQYKGGMPGLYFGVFLLLIHYFLMPIILTNPINKLTETEFQEGNPFVTEDAIVSILKNVKNIELTPNSLQLNDTQLKKLIDSHGQLQNFSLSISPTIPLDYRSAFAEVDLTSAGPTKEMIDMMSHMPHIKRRFLGFEIDPSLANAGRFYSMFIKWTYDNGQFDIQLFNNTNLEGKHPDRRIRHFPASTEFDTLAKRTLIQQMTIMKKIKMLSNEENEGFGSIHMVNLRPLARFAEKSFHRDAMGDVMPKHDPIANLTELQKLAFNVEVDALAKPFPNTTLTRNLQWDSILSLTYEPTASIETYGRIVDYKRDMTTGKMEDQGTIIAIPPPKRKGMTKLMDQSQGVQHSLRGEGIGKTRNILGIFILPNDMKTFNLKKNLILKPRS